MAETSPLHPTQAMIDTLSKTLVDTTAPQRYLVEAEDQRVARLLHEGFEDTTQAQKEHTQDNLNRSREMIRDLLLGTPYESYVDDALNTQSKDSILPPILRDAYHRTEASLEEAISFPRWMANYATDDQLINVWQWHDAYLRHRNDDPQFKERLKDIKDGYQKGIEAAVAAGELDPSVQMTPERLDRILIEYGSPFSPILAQSNGYTNQKDDIVQIREDASDFVIYHEMTHLQGAGLWSMFEEGLADSIATLAYNHSHPTEEHVNPADSIYRPQMQALASVQRLTEGRMSLRLASAIRTGPDQTANMIDFVEQADQAIGLPALLTTVVAANKDMQHALSTHSSDIAKRFTQQRLQENLALLETLLLDDGGHNRREDLHTLKERILALDEDTTFSVNAINNASTIIIAASQASQPNTAS